MNRSNSGLKLKPLFFQNKCLLRKNTPCLERLTQGKTSSSVDINSRKRQLITDSKICILLEMVKPDDESDRTELKDHLSKSREASTGAKLTIHKSYDSCISLRMKRYSFF